MEPKFYHCPICGNVIVKLSDSGVIPVCCGKPMEELSAKTDYYGHEKHLPAVTVLDDCLLKVAISDEPHPMTDAHYIQWIYLENGDGGQFVKLEPNSEPFTVFCTCKRPPMAVYAYCNIHGLWKTEQKDFKSKAKCIIRKFFCKKH